MFMRFKGLLGTTALVIVACSFGSAGLAGLVATGPDTENGAALNSDFSLLWMMIAMSAALFAAYRVGSGHRLAKAHSIPRPEQKPQSNLFSEALLADTAQPPNVGPPTPKDTIKLDFLAMMSHEIRTPLNAIIGMFELLARSEIPDRHRNRAMVGKEAAENLHSLLTKLLDASRLEANKVDAVFEICDIGQLVKFARETGEAMHAKSRKDILLTASTNVPAQKELITDVMLIRQIIANLIDNAVRFTASGRIDITFDCDDRNGLLQIRVADTGLGIPEPHRDAIFEPFHQVDDNLRRTLGGSGLGLSISKRAAKLLGGDLVYEPNPDGGSVFIVSIPCAAEPIEGECNENLTG
jgi:signal transduction histidine kinase